MAAPRKTATQRAEAKAENSVDVTVDGVTYTISRNISLDVFDALSTVDDEGATKLPDLKKATQYLVGLAQWKQWRSKHSTSDELQAFFKAATEAVGAGK